MHGKRIQESTGSTSKTVAKEYEKRRKAELERAAVGLPIEQKANRIRTVSEVVVPCLAGYALNHRPKSVLFAKGRLMHVKRLLGGVLLSDLTDDRIKGYIRQRQSEGVCGRTVNMELGELSRAIGQPWSLLWPKVRKLEERKDVGRALSVEEQERLLDALNDCHTPHLPVIIPLLLLTGMRSSEALGLTWGQLDLMDKKITVGRAKSSSGTGRTIPINDDLASILARHWAEYVQSFGHAQLDHYVFAYGSPLPSDPTRHVTDIKLGDAPGASRSFLPPPRSEAHLRHPAGRERSFRVHDACAHGTHESGDAGAVLAHSNGGKAGCGCGRDTKNQERKFRASPCESPCSRLTSAGSIVKIDS